VRLAERCVGCWVVHKFQDHSTSVGLGLGCYIISVN
jgi:hypothetical protein